MLHAIKMYTGADGKTHFLEGYLDLENLSEVQSISFRETPPNSSYDWHTAPHLQYVITLSGMLEFTTSNQETFIIQPGIVLVALDDTGAGHKWKLMNDEPWKRVYVVLKPGAKDLFIPK